ncbi:LuxR family transcriptional regulator [Actinocorallia aurea]
MSAIIEHRGHARPEGSGSSRTGHDEPPDGRSGRREIGAAAGLLARETELAAIRSLLTGQGGPWLVFAGAPGLGKSALLDAAEVQALRRGLPVLRASGVQFEAGIGYAALHGLLAQHLERFTDLAPHLEVTLSTALGLREEPAPVNLALVQAVLRLLEMIGGSRGPAVIILDDLQWVDEASATVLSAVIRRTAPSTAVVVAAYRAGDAGFFSIPAEAERHLAPLNQRDSIEFARLHRPDVHAAERTGLAAQAEGNPLALSVLPPPRVDGRPPARSATLTMRITEVFNEHVARLPERTRDALLLVALDGSGDLSAVSGCGGFAGLEAAESAGVVQVDLTARRVSFRHPLVKVAVVDRSTARQRQQAHAVLAEQHRTDPIRYAWHLSESRTGPDETIASALEQAAHLSLRRGDAGLSVRLLTRAAALSPHPGGRARRLGTAAVTNAEVLGAIDSASQLTIDARMIHPEPSGFLAAAVARAYVMLNVDGSILTAQRLLTDAIEQCRDFSDTNHDLAEALAALAVVCWNTGSPQGWDLLQEFLGRITPRPPMMLKIAATFLRDPARHAPDCLPHLESLTADLTDVRDPLVIMRAAKACVYADRVARCRPALQHMAEAGRSGGAAAAAIHALTSLCVDRWMSGDWDQVEAISAEVGEFCRSRGNHRYSQPVSQYLEVLVRQARGRLTPDEEAELAAAAALSAAQGFGIARHFCQHSLALGALGRADFTTAYQALTAVIDPGVISADVAHETWLVLDLVEAAQRSGHTRQAAAHARAARSRGIAAISPRLALHTHAASALTADAADAGHLFETALAVPGADEFPFDYARVQLLYGTFLRRERKMTHVRALLDAALSTFQRLGAGPWAERAEAELRAGFPTRSARSWPTLPELTHQERQIAELAASGLTNKQIGVQLFLSHRTVGHHLYNIFPKLGITSRAALRDALKSLPEVSAPKPPDDEPKGR